MTHPDYPPHNGDPEADRCVCGGIRHWHAVAPYGCDDCDCTEFHPIEPAYQQAWASRWFKHGNCETHCVECGRCIEAGESYTTDHSGDVWFDVCDVCSVCPQPSEDT